MAPGRRRSRRRRACALALTLGAWGLSREAAADPQLSIGITTGVAGRGYERQLWDETAFHLGLRGDVFFARESVDDFGIGPYAEVLTLAFDEVQVGTGASLLIPVIDSAPLIVSSGIYGRAGDDDFGFEPGWASSLYFGAKSYNYSSPYVLTAGLLTEFRYGLGDSEEMSLLIAAQVDVVILALPFVFLIDAIRGGSSETDAVEPEISSVPAERNRNKDAVTVSF